MVLSDISCFQFCRLGCLQRLTYLRNCCSLWSRSGEGKESQLFCSLMMAWAQRSLSIWRKFVVYKSMQIYLSWGYCPTKKTAFGNPVRALFGWELLLTQQILPLLLPIKGSSRAGILQTHKAPNSLDSSCSWKNTAPV